MELSSGLIGAAIALGSMMVGTGVAWGRFRAKLEVVDKLEREVEGTNGTPSAFTRRVECERKHESLDEKLDCLETKAKAFENFARWYLTSKEGMSLDEVNRILKGVA